MKKNPYRRKYLFGVSLIILLTDQLSKIWANEYLSKGIPTDFIPNMLRFRLVNNTGAAFSILSNSTILLAILSLVVSLFLTFWIMNFRPTNIIMGTAFAILLGGCLGNGIDRWRLGYVIDFIEIVPFSFPIFNIADISINIAVILLLIDTLISRNKKTWKKK